MEKLNILTLKKVLTTLGEATSGGKNDLICRLQVSLEQKGISLEKALEKSLDEIDHTLFGAVEQSADTNEQFVDDGRYVSNSRVIEEKSVRQDIASELNDAIAPEDSASQIGAVRPRLFSNDARCTGRSIKSHTGPIPKVGRSRSLVSGVSRASSNNSRISALERKREFMAQRARVSATRELIEQAENLERDRELSRISRALEKKKQEELLIREKQEEELREKFKELELQKQISRLKRDAEDKALEAEAEVWNHFDQIDLGIVQDLGSRIPNVERTAGNPTLTGYPIDGTTSNKIPLAKQNFELKNEKQRVAFEMGEKRILGNSDVGKIGGKLPRDHADKHTFESNVIRDLMASNLRMCLPKLEVEGFSGRSEEYITFKQTIHVIMQSDTLPDEEKLRYMFQYTTGEPREIVRTALYMDPSDGLKEVWRCFEEKYGAPELIAGEFMDKLFARERIGRDDLEGLKSFGVSLRLTSNVVNKIPHARSELEHPKSLRALIAKLPYNMQEKWRVLVHERRSKSSGLGVNYQDLVTFVDREVRIASDPMYGRGAMEREMGYRVGSQQTRAKNRVTINAISYENNNKEDIVEREPDSLKEEPPLKLSCHHCGGGHDIGQCRKFVALNVGERLSWIKDKRGCFLCLGMGHMAGRCDKPKPCKECGRWHHYLLHSEGGWRRGIEDGIPWSTAKDFQARKLVGGVSTRGGTEIGSVSVLPVKVRGREGKVATVSAFLDGGSAVSFCTPRLLEAMSISRSDLQEVFLSSETVHSSRTDKTCLLTGLMVRGAEENTWVSLPPVYLIPKIPVDQKDVLRNRDIAQLAHLADISIGEVDEVDLMIGSNALAALEPIEIRPAPTPGDPYGIKTRLGWSIQGLVNDTAKKNVIISRIKFISDDMKKLVEDAFEVGFEDCGSDDRGFSEEDRRWFKIVEDGCKKVGGHYEIPLPIKESHDLVPDSKEVALRRAAGLRRKLLKNPQTRKLYEDCIDSMLEKGYAEKISCEDGGGKWYIPHFSVVNPRKPVNIRVVFDCASKVTGVALNDLLLQGPDFANQLVDVLLRFREGRFAFTADIEAMFHQIRVPTQQRDYLRFLWWDGGLESGSLSEYRMVSHLFGACSSPSVANYALRRVADDCEITEFKSVGDIIKNNFYVDDVLRAGNDKKLLCQEARRLRALCATGGFNLSKFASNVPEFSSVTGCTAELDGTGKCLGVKWDRDGDRLFVNVEVGADPGSMRKLLSVIASVYDPLGIVAPLVLEGRLIFQDIIRKEGIDSWDALFNLEHMRRISSWVSKLKTLDQFSVPRSLVRYENEIRSTQLHVFGDASESGHAVVAYARIRFSDSIITTTFVFGKAKVNPMKAVTIPRLELVAAKLAACVGQKLVSTFSFEFDSVTFWTDSMTVLRYLRNGSVRFKSFVANRIADIKRRTELDQWRYVPSGSNPADEGSRGYIDSKWLNGPSFLLDDENSWPTEEDSDSGGIWDLEVKSKVLAVTTNKAQNLIEKLIDRYSDWRKLIRAVAWLTKFKTFIANRDCCEMSYEERRQAEVEILVTIQRGSYMDEYDDLSNKRPLKKSSSLYRLAVFMQRGLLRVGGRLENADIPYGAKHPIILPASHPATDLIVRDCHQRVGHLGVSTVLGETRKEFWIVRGYSTVKRELSRCVTCKKIKGKVMEQQMASLPPERLAEQQAAFTFTGLDCFGPYYVTFGRGRTQVKRYGVVFTCMTVRAVHLEVAEDLSTDAIMRAIRRFMARRGRVQLFRSDNGTNFVGARRELLSCLNGDKLRTRVQNVGIKWELNPPKASHFGGVWERVIRTVRRVLETVMTGKKFSDDALHTVFCEAEAAVNSRPLSIIGNDPDSEPLTPQRLLSLGNSCEMLDTVPDVAVDVVKRWQHVQAVSTQFWRRWCQEYRSELQGRQKWVGPKDNIQVGDIVLVVDEAEARCHWPLGRITELKKSKDGKVRAVTLLSKGKIYKRPIAKLVFLVNGQTLP